MPSKKLPQIKREKIGPKTVDRLSPDKKRLVVAVPLTLLAKLKKLAKTRHVTLTAAVCSLLDEGVQEALIMSTMLSDPKMRHSLALAMATPDFKENIAKFMAKPENSQFVEETVFDLIDLKHGIKK